MDLICKTYGQGGIYEDGDYWVMLNYKGEEQLRRLKSDALFWPLSAVVKYDMEVVNQKRFNELAAEFEKSMKND